MPEPITYLVFSNPYEGGDEAYNQWYDEVHMPDVANLPEVVRAQRFELVESARDQVDPPAHRYLAMYELTGDPDAVLAQIRDGIADGSMVISDAVDSTQTKMSFWRPRGPRK